MEQAKKKREAQKRVQNNKKSENMRVGERGEISKWTCPGPGWLFGWSKPVAFFKRKVDGPLTYLPF
jgi:hypothetical protein